jgi:PAS domain S-box-containing protein
MKSKIGTPPDHHDRPFSIVVIGASAGGLQSLERFLSALPGKFGFALIFLQHLSPRHRNLLPDLLRSQTKGLAIEEITDGLSLLPGRLYLCKPAQEIRIEEETFCTITRTRPHTHLPIDEFLISLAETAPDRTIAVILSGAGTDGARGVQAVRTQGGTVFVQDPATAEYPDMPLAAINTGQMDGVLPPDEIAREILKFDKSEIGTVTDDQFMTPVHFDSVCQMVSERTGHRFNHYKRNVVARRVRRRMYLRGIASVNDYLKMLAKEDREAGQLASDLLIGVTSFFRDRLAWKALHLEVTRKLVIEEGTSPIRIWAAACATGEEAYSIAMMLHHELAMAGKKREIQVFATDVNDRALERAREGNYPASIVADLPPDYLRNYFTSAEDGLSVSINKEIRQHVIFARQDLLTDPPFSRLDLVICRNFLIYLEPDAQEKCIVLFHYALKENGYLFLGNAESPGRNKFLFTSLAHKKCRIYRKTEARRAARIPLSVPFAAERSPATKQKPATEYGPSITHFIQAALLEEHAPAAVAINQNHQILYHNGPTNRYLHQPRGTPTQNLMELLPEKLRNRLRGSLYHAAQEAKPVHIRASIVVDGRKRQVLIRISRLLENLFLITFRDRGGLPEEIEPSLDTMAIEETAVHQLESELAVMRDDLESHIEELKSVNEELESSNEELQAANEELETSREELQSLNEELTTVNAQLQTKIEEQEETNDDLTNFLASTSIPTIFLDHRFRVKRFTPAMSRLITLIPADIGRSIMDMSRENLGSDLIADAQSVLDNLVPVRKELSIDGSWYIRTALPYRTSDNRIEGVVIIYTDVTEMKRVEGRVRHLASFPELNPNPVLEIDLSGEVTFCNPSTPRILKDLGVYEGHCNAFLPRDMRSILSTWDRRTEVTAGREIKIGNKIFDEVIQLVPHFNVARIYGRDITKRKHAEEALEESRRRLAVIVDSIADGFFAMDRDWRIIHVNDAALGHFGKTRAEMVGRRFLEVFPETQGTSFDVQYRHAMESGEPVHFEVASIISDKTMEVHAYPGPDAITVLFRDVTERIRMQAALAESEERVRRKLENILSPEGDIGSLDLADIIDVQAIQSLMADFSSLTRIPVAIIDLKGNVLVGEAWQDICTKFHRVHPETCKYCVESDTQLTIGVSPGESKLYKCRNNMWDIATPIMVGGQHVGNIFSGQFFFEDEPVDCDLFRARAQRYEFNEDEYLRALDAVPRLSKETVDRAIAYLMKLAHMLSQLSYSNIKLARSLAQGEALLDSLRESAQRQRFHLENSPLAVVEWDRDFIIVTWSREAERIFGWSAGETVGRRIDSLNMIYEEDIPIVTRTMERLTGGEERTVVSSNRNYTKSGAVIECTWYNSVLLDGKGEMASVMSLILDITERTRAQDELKKAHDELEKRVEERTAELQQAYDRLAEESKHRQEAEGQLRQAHKMEAVGTLASGIAHDFNNILGAVIGFTELVQDKLATGSEEAHNLSRVMEAGLRGRDLVKRLLTFSRKTEQDKKPLQLGRAVSETLRLLRASIPSTVSIRKDVGDEPGLVLADPVQIQQLLMNLCTNAAWSMKDKGGILDVKVSGFMVSDINGGFRGMKPGRYTRLQVRDTGFGMAPEILNRIFDPFFTTKGPGEGSGLGLSAVHGIVAQHSGYIFVDSEPGKGSVFTIYFPVVEEDLPIERATDEGIPGGSERVLLVDDEEMLVEMGETLLTRLGYTVTSTTSAPEASDLIRSDPGRFDVVITDMTMPSMTGIDLAREILALRADMPIILSTGFSHLVDKESAKAAGIRAFVMKPLTKKELAQSIRKALAPQENIAEPSAGE